MRKYLKGMRNAAIVVSLYVAVWCFLLFIGRWGFVELKGGQIWSPFLHFGFIAIISIAGAAYVIVGIMTSLPNEFFEPKPRLSRSMVTVFRPRPQRKLHRY